MMLDYEEADLFRWWRKWIRTRRFPTYKTLCRESDGVAMAVDHVVDGGKGDELAGWPPGSLALTMDGFRDLMDAFRADIAGRDHVSLQFWVMGGTGQWAGSVSPDNKGPSALATDFDHAECAIELLFEWLILGD